jgi:hypothetical protein
MLSERDCKVHCCGVRVWFVCPNFVYGCVLVHCHVAWLGCKVKGRSCSDIMGEGCGGAFEIVRRDRGGRGCYEVGVLGVEEKFGHKGAQTTQVTHREGN